MDTSTELANGLDRDLAALNAKAPTSARPPGHRNAAGPPATRIAVNFTADFDAMLLRRVAERGRPSARQGDFGWLVGIWRLIELFYSHAHQGYDLHTRPHLRALFRGFNVPHPEAATTIADHIWSTRFPKIPALEREHLPVLGLDRTLTRPRPVGTRIWHTRHLLLE